MLDPLITATEDPVFQSNQVAAKLGQAVSGAGDINGNGYGDVIIGAPYFDAGQSDEGAAFVFLGSASGLVANSTPANAHRQLESDGSGAPPATGPAPTPRLD